MKWAVSVRRGTGVAVARPRKGVEARPRRANTERRDRQRGSVDIVRPADPRLKAGLVALFMAWILATAWR